MKKSHTSQVGQTLTEGKKYETWACPRDDIIYPKGEQPLTRMGNGFFK